MTDSLDSLYQQENVAAPDPQFRAELMDRLAAEFRMNATDQVIDQTSEFTEVVMSTHPTLSSRRPRQRLLAGLGLAAAAAVIIGLLIVNSNGKAEPVEPVATTERARPALTDAQIAAAALLTRVDVGGGYVPVPGSFGLDRATGPGSDSPACTPFLDTVFESPNRPATVRIQTYGKPGDDFEQYVAVFPDESGAIAMMNSVADPGFPACIAAVSSDAYESGTGPFQPISAISLEPVGDEMDVITLHSTYTFAQQPLENNPSFAFVRVGRVVTWMNPDPAANPYNAPGYSDELLQHALGVIVAHLLSAQGTVAG